MQRFWFKRVRPWQLGSGGGCLATLVLGYGWYRCGENLAELGLALSIGFAVGFALYLLAKLEWRAWLAVYGILALIGLASTVELLLEQPFERQCFVALATMLFWVALGVSLGMLAEFIRLLHRLAHRLAHGEPEPEPPAGRTQSDPPPGT